MDNEATRLINEEQTSSVPPTQSEATKPRSRRGNVIAGAAGGFVAGVTAGAAASMHAQDHESIPEEGSADDVSAEASAPEMVILANDEGIRYAHVDATNFNDAFAQARQQVGPGGVFEYNGRLYGTYYADEWNNMTSRERADYQSRVNEVAPSHNASSHSREMATHLDATPDAVPANAEMISAEPVDNEIRVLGVETVQSEAGGIMNIALVECEGDHALLVDVDNNGTIDVLLHDDDGDGHIQDAEIHDISGAGLEVADLMAAHASQHGDMLYASNDDMPDYINDADSMVEV